MIGLEDLQAEVPPSPERRVHTPSLQFSFGELSYVLQSVALSVISIRYDMYLSPFFKIALAYYQF